MNERLFYQWLGKCSGISDPANVARIKAYFEKRPDIDRVLNQAITEHLDLGGIGKLIQGGATTQTSPPSPQITSKVKKPSFSQVVVSLLKMIKSKKKTVPEASPEAEAPKQKSPLNKKKLIGIGVGILVLVVAGILAVSYFGGQGAATPDITFAIPTEAVTQQMVEAPPTLIPVPIDLRSSDWFKPIQILILVEVIGLLAALGMDAKIRKQWFDALVPFLAVLLVIFVSGGKAFGSWGILAIALIPVLIVSFNGGKDFSPIGTFLTLTGAAGGLIFNKIMAVQTAFGIQAASVLPIGQMAVLFQLKAWDQMYFPLIVYAVLTLGLVFSVLEAVRPSNDKNPRWGTVVGGGVGILAFFLLFHLTAIPAWGCYIVAFALAIGVSAASQNERIIRVVTDKWGIRTMFDSAMLLTSVLLVFQLFTGVPALF